jgi:ribose/xylose/arabinose/galactoside ABC-type transport system permease subunit
MGLSLSQIWKSYSFVGDNKDSSQMMGINVDNIKIIAFVQLGFFSSLAGIFTMYEMLYFWPTQGSGLMLTYSCSCFCWGALQYLGVREQYLELLSEY